MTTCCANLTNRAVFLLQSRDNSHHVTQPKYPPMPIHLPLLHRLDRQYRSSSIWLWLGGILLLSCVRIIKWPARILAPPQLLLQKHTDLRAHEFTHSLHFWQEPRLANCSYAWSQRLYGNTRTNNIYAFPACSVLYPCILPYVFVVYCEIIWTVAWHMTYSLHHPTRKSWYWFLTPCLLPLVHVEIRLGESA